MFQGLKVRAEVNNHAKDPRHPGEMFLAGLQQRLLNMARMQCVQHAVLQEEEQ